MTPLAVLFDFEGVIADTANHHIAAWQRTLLAMGWQVPDEVAAKAAEQDDTEFLTELFAKHELNDGDVAGWVKKKQDLTLQMLHDSPRVYGGVVSLVKSLKGKVRLGVVSTAWRQNIEAILIETGLKDAFDVIVAKEDAVARKPAPDSYKLALEKLGVKPGRAVAIEDSPTGLAAAKAARMTCLAVGHRREFGAWVGDAVYFSSLEPVSSVLKHLHLPE